jgi:hypothetical protein
MWQYPRIETVCKKAEIKLKYRCNECGTWKVWLYRYLIEPPDKSFKEKFGSHSRKTISGFTTKYSYTWNITHNMESTAV